jgi:hypothetical protein
MNKAFSILFLLAAFSPISADEQMVIGIIDFYGLRSLTEEQVSAALPISEGIVVSDDYAFPDEKARLVVAEALGVFRVELSPTCCYEPYKLVVYVGIEEEQTSTLQYRDEPVGDKELPAEILETARKLETAMIAAVQKGDSGDDWSQGHSLMMNSDVRTLQQKYVEFAEIYRDTLIEVLRGSAQQRALAATVLAYSSDKKSIVPHLEAAVLDPDVNVRNDASRALAVIAAYANENPELDIRIDAAIFVDMLNSVAFDDRNKSAAVLLNLTDSRDPHIVEQIRAKALLSLIEMCQWEWEGHAWTPCKILERAVDLPDQEELHPKDESISAALELLRAQADE